MVYIKDVMSQIVYTIDKNKTILDAAKEMSTKGVSCLVIKENENIEGIITRRDILEKVVAEKIKPETVKVVKKMSLPVITINENAALIAASGIMNVKKVKQLPVVNKNKLVVS